jgi:hypothetical protein
MSGAELWFLVGCSEALTFNNHPPIGFGSRLQAKALTTCLIESRQFYMWPASVTTGTGRLKLDLENCGRKEQAHSCRLACPAPEVLTHRSLVLDGQHPLATSAHDLKTRLLIDRLHAPQEVVKHRSPETPGLVFLLHVRGQTAC